MIRYAILDAGGVVVGLGDALTDVEMIGSAPEGCTTTGLGDDEWPLPLAEYLGGDERFHPLPPRPAPWVNWNGTEWIDPRTPEEIAAGNEAAWERLRIKRNSYLATCDWTQVPDAPLTETQRADWREYRQALRDLTETTADPLSPVWPEAPI